MITQYAQLRVSSVLVTATLSKASSAQRCAGNHQANAIATPSRVTGTITVQADAVVRLMRWVRPARAVLTGAAVCLLFSVTKSPLITRVLESSLNAIINLSVDHQGLYDITHKVLGVVERSPVNEGLVTLFIRHTSASLLIQENADPAVCRDLEAWLNRLVPEGDPLYTHTQEGADDMPAHIKAALTQCSLSIPLMSGRLALGTWQGIYLWEHRHHRKSREVIVNVTGE